MDEFLMREYGLLDEEVSTEEQSLESEVENAEPTEEQPVEAAVAETPDVQTPVEEPAQKESGAENNTVDSKLKVDYNKWLEENEQTISTYLKEKNTDYKSLDAATLATLKFKKENPHLSEDDIKEDLADKYGIGMDKLSEDPDDYTDDSELKEAKSFNKELSKKQRELKRIAPELVNEFEQAKSSISLPEFEIDNPTPVVNEEEYINTFIEKQQEQVKEHSEKVWKPLVEKEIGELSEISTEVTLEINGNKEVITVKYALSDSDKEQLKTRLNGYVADEYDSSTYVNENGDADFKRFFVAKAKEMNVDKLIAVAVKEATTKTKSDIFKKDIVNYTEEIRDVAPKGEPDDLESFILNRNRN